jgi:hypothetical protein
VCLLIGKESVDGFLEAAVKELLEAVEGDQRWGRRGDEADLFLAFRPPPYVVGYQFGREVEPMYRGQEEQRADAFVEVLGLSTEGVQFGAGGEQLLHARRLGKGVEGPVADRRVRGRDEANETLHT